MKRRMGFVTNSSSSNFIIAGWEKNALEFDEKLSDLLYKDRDVVYDTENGLLGIWIGSWEDGVCCSKGLTLEELQRALEKTDKLEDIRVALGCKGPPKILVGTRWQ